MKDYSAMSDFEINKQVAVAIGASPYFSDSGDFEKSISQCDESVIIKSKFKLGAFDPCNNPSDAWPIILENGINIFTDMIPHGLLGQARLSVIDDGRIGSECLIAKDKNPLRAAMLVFLMMKDEAVNTQGEKV